ncbi:MAG: hypothetical protein JW811_08205 [Clostridiales bacterium]|nr:hypothetical protein [Clostridiales bacterium]
MLEFFKNGGVFLFDENDAASERTFYRLEDLMGEEEGADITETYIDEDGEICVYYDSSVLSEEQAIEKYNNGEYVTSL